MSNTEGQFSPARPSESIGRSPILLIDDSPENLLLLQRMLEWAGYANVTCCTSAQDGMDALRSIKPDLIILDLMMPGMDGYGFLEAIRDASTISFIPVLVFTADMTAEARNKALELGASDFLTKPGDANEIQLRVRNFLRMRNMHLELANQNQILEIKVSERTGHLLSAWKETVEILARACEFRDDETGKHVQRVGVMSAAIARELGQSHAFAETLRLAAPLHDIGKIGIPDSILHKPEKLTEDEFALMQSHCHLGAKLIGEIDSPLLKMAREIALYHHERWDGSGYDTGLAGEAIPLSARIVSVADAFDAMTNDRPYRTAVGEHEALAELSSMSGTQFDPSVVEALHAHLSGMASQRMPTAA
jgi:putative two-component system response regulator